MTALVVLQTGSLSLIQDLGRCGFASIGVSRSGAFDRDSLALANRLVGNDEGDACIESILGGLILQARSTTTLAVTGAIGPVYLGHADDHRLHAVDRRTPCHLGPGDSIHVGPPDQGLRTYLAVRGGIAFEPVLGSRAHDMLSGLGPPPLTTGQLLHIGPEPGSAITVDHAPLRPVSGFIDVIPGPHHRSPDGLIGAQALSVLQSAEYLVEPSSNRIGVRLAGPALPRIPGELPSAPMRPGAIQVPGNGQPIVLGPDAPTTGGFPVVATLTPSGFAAIGQARPGDRVRFRVWSDHKDFGVG